jgi:hypothetical protein
MQPLFKNGTQVIADKTVPVKNGDVAVLIYRPEYVPAGLHQASLKRVVMAPPPYVKFPFREHAKSEVKAIVILEQLNPPKQFMIGCDQLLAVHKVVGTQ